MAQRDAERLADGLWRQLRPVLVALVDATLTDTGPICSGEEPDEAAHIERSVADQLERYRAKHGSKPATRSKTKAP